MTITVSVPGSCGELLQGVTRAGRPFLVTCPIDRYATATIVDDGQRRWRLGYKAREAAEKTLAHLGVTSYTQSIAVTSELPKGKGMASSTADICAVSIGVAASLGQTLTEQDIMTIAASIEPTDGVCCRGLCCLEYESGKIMRSYGDVPALDIVVLDTGGSLNTVEFHRRHPVGTRQHPYIRQGLDLLRQEWSATNLGKAATWSALANQDILYKKDVSILARLVPTLGAVGLVVAHSGTVIGLLFPKNKCRGGTWAALGLEPILRQHGVAAAYMDTVSLISGGYTITYR